jgi:MFS superfamily sulfate permease-like transporter
LPALQWLRTYDWTWLRGDVVAGITLAAYLLPAGLGDASLANLPPESGLYACLFGGLVFRPESSLLYFNMDHVRDTILERARAEGPPPGLVVLDLSAAAHVDMHGAHMLAELAGELTSAGIGVQAVEARSAVRDRLRSEGVDAKLGVVNRFASVADTVEAFQKQNTT